MTERPMYHDGQRRLQDRFDSRRIADRLEQVTVHTVFSARDRDLIERSPMFFLATADANGYPDCSYKGGLPGFVRVVDEHTVAWGDYDGNGMFRSLGNLLVNPRVQLLFVDFEEPRRLRFDGVATVSDGDPLLASLPGAQLVVRVAADRIFPNCPRYIHRMKLVEHSVYAPRPEHVPPVPGWKEDPNFRDHLPARPPGRAPGHRPEGDSEPGSTR